MLMHWDVVFRFSLFVDEDMCRDVFAPIIYAINLIVSIGDKALFCKKSYPLFRLDPSFCFIKDFSKISQQAKRNFISSKSCKFHTNTHVLAFLSLSLTASKKGFDDHLRNYPSQKIYFSILRRKNMQKIMWARTTRRNVCEVTIDRVG